MKHAYLILAHNEFRLLQRLVQTLDDPRNDIYVHVDRKVNDLPKLNTAKAGLIFLEDRVDVRWGDVSVVEAELLLFETAARSEKYAYYHLLSGVDMPLKSQDEIHAFCTAIQGKELIGFYQHKMDKEIDRKVNRYHLFPRSFREKSGMLNNIRRTLRYAYLKLQYGFGIRRNIAVEFKKGAQWVSLTDPFVRYLLQHTGQLLQTYTHTFCSDEIFIQTLCWHSPFREKVYDLTDEGRGCMRMIGWQNNQLKDWEDKDFEALMASDALFARKFNSRNMAVVDRILQEII